MQDGASKLGKDLSEDDELPTGEWQYTFRGVMAGDYTVTEGNIAGYHAKGNVTSVPISITRADMWSRVRRRDSTATYEASFTNVKADGGRAAAVRRIGRADLADRGRRRGAGAAACGHRRTGRGRTQTAVTELPDGNRNSLIAIRQSQFSITTKEQHNLRNFP